MTFPRVSMKKVRMSVKISEVKYLASLCRSKQYIGSRCLGCRNSWMAVGFFFSQWSLSQHPKHPSPKGEEILNVHI